MAIKWKATWAVAIAATMLTLSACSAGGNTGTGDVPEEILIGGIHPRTGAASYYGLPMDQGVELAVSEINEAGGVPVGDSFVKLTYQAEDSKSDPTVGVAALRKLTTAGADFVVGPLSSAVLNALRPIIESSDTLLLVDGAADPTEGLFDPPGMFRWIPGYVSMDEKLIETITDMDPASVVILNDVVNPAFANSVAGVESSIEEAGVEVFDTRTFSTGDTDFRAQLTSVLSSGAPEVIVVRGYALESTLVTSQSRELGYEGQLVWEVLAPPETVSGSASAEALNGVINVIYATPAFLQKVGDEDAIAFAEAYMAEFGEAPGEDSSYSYDVVKTLAAAIEAAGSVDPIDVGKALSEIKLDDLELVNTYNAQDGGRLFDEIGQAWGDVIVMQWRDGDWYPPED